MIYVCIPCVSSLLVSNQHIVYVFQFIYNPLSLQTPCLRHCICMHILYAIPWVSGPQVSSIVYVCIFIRDPLSLQSPGLRHLYIIPGVSSPQFSKILFLCIFSMCTITRDLQHGLCMFINTNAPPSAHPPPPPTHTQTLFVDHHHLD